MIQNWRQARHHDPSTISLLSLPNDLLLIVAGNLELENIKPLLLVNRRLSFLLTPTYQSLAIEQLGIMHWDDFPGLHWAAAKGHKTLVKLLLERGVNINMQAKAHGTTALHYSAMNGQESVVRLLLRRGATVDARDHVFKETASLEGTGNKTVNLHGMTPLHYAAVAGKEGIVRLLLDAGANIEARDQVNQRTALILATSNDRKAVVRILLERGADVAAVDRYGWKALSYAVADDTTNPVNGPGSYRNRTASLLETAEKRRRKKLSSRKLKLVEPGEGGSPNSGKGLEGVKGYCSDDYQQIVGEFLSLGEGPVAMGTAAGLVLKK